MCLQAAGHSRSQLILSVVRSSFYLCSWRMSACTEAFPNRCTYRGDLPAGAAAAMKLHVEGQFVQEDNGEGGGYNCCISLSLVLGFMSMNVIRNHWSPSKNWSSETFASLRKKTAHQTLSKSIRILKHRRFRQKKMLRQIPDPIWCSLTPAVFSI